MNFLKANRLSLLALFVMSGISLLLFNDLPAELPDGFNWNGEVRGYKPKALMVIISPMAFLISILVMNLMIHISPQKYSMSNSKRPMDIFLFGVGILMCFVHYSVLVGEGDIDFVLHYMSYGFACFLLIVGNIFGKIERNFFIGLRLPWTIASVENWRATHRFAGKLMVVGGATLLISNSVIPNIFLTALLTMGPVLIPILYSFLYYQRNERNGESA